MVNTTPLTESEEDLEDDTMTYRENVMALSKLTEGKSPAAVQVVYDLLDVTRCGRLKWLSKGLLIQEDILESYPCFRKSKWVWSRSVTDTIIKILYCIVTMHVCVICLYVFIVFIFLACS